jgi:hypothetical protein
MRARLRVVATATAAAAVIAAIPASRAAANPVPVSPGASAYSAAAGTGTAALTASLRLKGALGGLLDGLISPIVDTALNPLLSALHGTVNSLVASTLGTSSHLNAGTPDQQYGTAPAAFPSDTIPSPCDATGPQPCFSVTSGTAINAAPLATVGLNLINGYTQQVPVAADATNSIFARAGVTGPTISALPGIASLVNPIVSAGAVNAKANCPNDGPVGSSKPTTPPSALVSASSVTMLGGLITLDVLSGQIANLHVNGVSYASVASLPVLNVAGVAVAPYGNSLIVTIGLSATQILNGLGLDSSVVSQLLGLAPTSTLALRVIVGPNAQVTSATATAWGLGVGVDLSGSLGFDLLGLVGATVTVPTGITSRNYGNLLDLRLAYTVCKSGTNTPAVIPAVPPTLV